MEASSQENRGSITFANEPKFTDHEADKEFNERRRQLAHDIQDFIATHSLFKGKRVEVTFSHNGISSLVSILDTGEQKFVLKIPLKVNYSRSEATFLRAWERVGVHVPHVVEAGEIGEHHYLLMEYIDALTLRETYIPVELVENETYIEMGSTLRKMHTAAAEGYGDLVDGKAEYADIQTWLESSQLQEKIPYVKEHALLNDTEHGSIERSFQILFTKIGTTSNTVYGHSDFSVGNIFATQPLTVFDPIPFLNHPYMDLARSMILAVRAGLVEAAEQLVQGYFNDEDYDPQLLQACLVVNAYQKVGYFHMTNRLEAIKNIQTYLTQGRHLLP
ncbi:MAG: hypothetical protein JWN49_747 [Parcubacteria group bacterium]|nr:hypothetical protein [Parcubacteria group bacterium]